MTLLLSVPYIFLCLNMSFLLLSMENLSLEKSTAKINFRVYENVIMPPVKS